MRKPFYGWVIVAAGTILLFMQAGIVSSFGVFFKPLAVDLDVSRTAISSIDSLFRIIAACFIILVGWLIDRVKPERVSIVISFLLGLGLILTSFTTDLWQLYFTYSFLIAVGSQNMVIGATTVSRWFDSHRGMALGILSAGVGLGTLVVPPIAGYLIASYGWAKTYIFLGIAVWLISMPVSQLLKSRPRHTLAKKEAVKHQPDLNKRSFNIKGVFRKIDINIRTALHTRAFWTLFVLYFIFSFCSQMILVHLVNHATDIGIVPVLAATLLSAVGIGSACGRLIMGALADKIDSLINLIICSFILIISFILLIFTSELILLYVFAILFGFAYGGEVPQLPMLIMKYFGDKSLGVLSGILLSITSIGGATGSILGGLFFDITQSYQTIFLVCIIITIIALFLLFSLRKSNNNSPA